MEDHLFLPDLEPDGEPIEISEINLLASMPMMNGNGSPQQPKNDEDGQSRPPKVEHVSNTLPPAHPPVPEGATELTCPFAAIQMVLDQQIKSPESSQSGNSKEDGHERAGTARLPSREVYHKTNLDDQTIEEHKESTDFPEPPAMDQKEPMSHIDDAKSSHMSEDKSKGGKSKMSKSSRSSGGSKKGRNIAKRTRKAPTFSQWEADNYIPIVKKSWKMVCKKVSLEDRGLLFYDTLFDEGGDDFKAMFTTERTIMAAKFGDMLNEIVASVDQPYNIYKKLRGLAPMHLQKGVNKDHLPIMGATLFKVLGTALGSGFDEKMKAAWDWLWAWMGSVMNQTLEEAGNNTTLVSQSWDLAMDNYPEDQIGGLLFDTLMEMAPNLRAVFHKPRQVLALKFTEMMGAMVGFQNRLDEDNEQLVWLGLRHIQYGAKRQHINVLGQVLLGTLEKAVAQDWTQEMAESWQSLWEECCDKLLTVTEAAEQHGQNVRDLWAKVQTRSSRQQFGTHLRKMLLSGTEWVQSLSGAAQMNMSTSKETSNNDISINSVRRTSKEEKAPLTSSLKSSLTNSKAAAKTNTPTTTSASERAADANNSEAVGNQFWEMLTEMLELLWEPELQHEKLTKITKRFFEVGIRENHLPIIGNAILTSSRNCLGHEMSTQYEEAWEWFWNMISKSMARTLRVCEEEHAQVLRESWELCKNGMTTEDLGETIFKELARIAPHVVHLFKRPKRIQAHQFVSAVDMLITFVEDPDDFYTKLRPLTIRHIKYGVKAEYAKAFGGGVLKGVEKALLAQGAEHWDSKTQHAWTVLWNRVQSVIQRSLNAGTNLVVVALVTQDVVRMQEAMQCAPRRERDKWITRVDINGEILSPLYWSIRDGMRDIALYLLQDLTALRADRESYYYGREILFETHPDIVKVLCEDPGALPLLDTLFDGLMWHGDTVIDGQLGVNYYIKELYGDPSKDNLWDTGLAVLAVDGPPLIFEHPVVQKLLEMKWESFGLAVFMMLQTIYIILTVAYFVGFVTHGEQCEEWFIIRLAVGGAAILLLVIQGIIIFRQARTNQWCQIPVTYPRWLGRYKDKLRLPNKVYVPRYLTNMWNSIRIPVFIVIVIATFSDKCLTGGHGDAHADCLRGGGSDCATVDDSHRRLLASSSGDGESHEIVDLHHVLTAIGTLVLGVQILEVTLLYPALARLLLIVKELSGDAVRMMLLLTVVLVSTAGAITVTQEAGFEDFGQSIVHLMKIFFAYGNNDLDYLEPFGLSLIFIFMILSYICLLNMVIAQMTHASQNIHQLASCLVQQKIAYTCVEMESMVPSKYARQLYDSWQFDKPLDFGPGDDGPSGGIKAVEPASVRSHPKYKPDRIQRFTGEALASDPWPVSETVVEEDVVQE